jgi:hypothetical protein
LNQRDHSQFGGWGLRLKYPHLAPQNWLGNLIIYICFNRKK